MTFKELHLAKNHGMSNYNDEGFSFKQMMDNQSAIIKFWFGLMLVTFALILFNF